MWKNRILYILILLASLISYIIADKSEALVLLCTLTVIPFIILFIQILAMRSISIQCDVKNDCLIGKSIPIVFNIKKSSKMPLGVVRANALFENILFAEKKTVQINFQPNEEKNMIFEYQFPATLCGVLRINISSIYYFDMLGLFKWQKNANIIKEIRIYPIALNLNIEFSRRPEIKNFGDIYDQYKKGHDVSEVIDLRDYVNGDSINSIHWKLSSKLDKNIVREFGSPSNYNTLILYEMMKESGNAIISNDCNKAVLSITIALSYSMMKMGLEHNVGRNYMGELRMIPVNSLRTHEQMTKNLLYIPIQEKESGKNMSFVFLRGNYRNEFTKIIYITPIYDDMSMKHIANVADLTVINVVEGKNLKYISQTGYTVIPVNIETYENDVHTIVL